MLFVSLWSGYIPQEPNSNVRSCIGLALVTALLLSGAPRTDGGLAPGLQALVHFETQTPGLNDLTVRGTLISHSGRCTTMPLAAPEMMRFPDWPAAMVDALAYLNQRVACAARDERILARTRTMGATWTGY